jgi:hypothetical protein
MFLRSHNLKEMLSKSFWLSQWFIFVVVALGINPRDSHMVRKSPLPLSYIQSHLLFFSGLEIESHSVVQAALEFTM